MEEVKIEPGQLPIEEATEILEKIENGSFNSEGDMVEDKTGEEEEKTRQQLAWDYYVQSVIAGHPNAKESALKAGFSLSFSEKITTQKWFKDRKKKLDRMGMLSQAEKNLHKILTMPYTSTRIKNGEEVMEVDTDILRIVLDTSKIIVKSLGKDEGYSDRNEVTGKGGEPIVFMPAELLSKYGLNK